VKSNQIVRLVRGVFIQPVRNKPMPSIEEIAQVKARSFARTSVVHRKDCAKELDIAENGNDKKKHLCSGRTSSFLSIHGRVYSHATSPRKMNVGSGNTGRVIKGLWSIGKDDIDTKIVKKALSTLKRPDWNILFTIFHYMPHWMTDFIHCVELDLSRQAQV
jgi:superfamily I DNA and RNA helicase